jgi:hypothetical protein
MSALSKILKLAGDLTKHELLMLNQAVVALAKTREDEELFKASAPFEKGDLIFYIDGASNIKVHGVFCPSPLKGTLVICNIRDF